MIQFLNTVACLISAVICGLIAADLLDQEFVRRAYEPYFWFGTALFVAVAVRNVRGGK